MLRQADWTVPCPPGQTFELSSWDKRYPPSYSKRILCFSLPAGSNVDQIMESLLHALTDVVTNHVPQLAGTVVAGDRPWLHDLEMQGSAHLRMRDYSSELSYAALKDNNFRQDLLDADKLCCFPKTSYGGLTPIPVCGIQANFVQGGLLLTMEIAHVAFDGKAITNVIELLAFKMKNRSKAHAEALDFRDTADRSLLSANFNVPGNVEFHPGFVADDGSVQSKFFGTISSIQSKMFHIPATRVAALKQLANDGIKAAAERSRANPARAEDEISWASTHDSLVSFLWQSVMRARIQESLASQDSDAILLLPFDFRKTLGLPEPYLGNALYPVQPVIATKTLTSANGFAEAALAIRRTIASVDRDIVFDALALNARVQHQTSLRMNVVDKLDNTGVLVTSYYSFPMYEMDFGEVLGRIESLRLPGRGFRPGIHIVMPRQVDGSVDVLVCETEAVMERLGKDPFFTKMTQST